MTQLKNAESSRRYHV